MKKKLNLLDYACRQEKQIRLQKWRKPLKLFNNKNQTAL
jgi:hypothetical protein